MSAAIKHLQDDITDSIVANFGPCRIVFNRCLPPVPIERNLDNSTLNWYGERIHDLQSDIMSYAGIAMVNNCIGINNPGNECPPTRSWVKPGKTILTDSPGGSGPVKPGKTKKMNLRHRQPTDCRPGLPTRCPRCHHPAVKPSKTKNATIFQIHQTLTHFLFTEDSSTAVSTRWFFRPSSNVGCTSLPSTHAWTKSAIV